MAHSVVGQLIYCGKWSRSDFAVDCSDNNKYSMVFHVDSDVLPFRNVSK